MNGPRTITAAVALLLTLALLAACGPATPPADSQVVPVPPPDTLPTDLRTRQSPEPPLDYILVAFHDRVTASDRARVLEGIDGVVVGGVHMGESLPPSYVVRVPAAEDAAALEALVRRLRALEEVFASGMVPSGLGGD